MFEYISWDYKQIELKCQLNFSINGILYIVDIIFDYILLLLDNLKIFLTSRLNSLFKSKYYANKFVLKVESHFSNFHILIYYKSNNQ